MTPPDHIPAPGGPLDDGPLDDDALAVQAVVDDEATAEQRRRVARDPELVAQVGALRAAVAAVAAPVDPPADEVLAALRRRAVAALDEPDADEIDDEGADPAAGEASPAAGPVRDLGAARARRSRSLPPLPAVAAVVILLVVVGVGLLVAGTGGKEAADQASSSGASDATVAESEEGGSGDANAAETEEDPESAFSTGDGTGSAGGPSADLQAELLAQAEARFGSDDELVTELQRVDPDTLVLGGSTTDTDEGTQASTTTQAASEEAPTTAAGTLSARSFARDPVVTRCDDVLRGAEPDLEPVTAAVLVEVDGIPVLVLSNPVEVSDDAPSGIRLTVLNAVDCSPRAAVLR